MSRERAVGLRAWSSITFGLLLGLLLVPVGGNRLFAEKLPIVDIIVCASHHDVLPHWIRLAREGRLPRKGVSVIHLDSHPDMAVPHRPLPSGFPRNDRVLQYSINIASFQLAAARIGLIKRVVWLRPPWAGQIPDGKHDFTVGRNEQGLTRVDSPLDYYVLGGAWAPRGKILEPVKLQFETTTLAKPVYHRPVNKGDFILDVDLDIFSTRNPAAEALRHNGFKEAEIKSIKAIFARESLNLSDEPAERLADVNVIKDSITALTSGAWYEIPGAVISLWIRGIGPGDIYTLHGILGPEKTDEQVRVLLREAQTLVGIPEYKTKPAEISDMVEQLRRLAGGGMVRPKLVTIARSVHDGFTHREAWPLIERTVLAALTDALGGRVRIIYDGKLKPAP